MFKIVKNSINLNILKPFKNVNLDNLNNKFKLVTKMLMQYLCLYILSWVFHTVRSRSQKHYLCLYSKLPFQPPS